MNIDIERNIERPWEQLPGERKVPHSCARQFFQLGPTRSIDQLSRKVNRKFRQLTGWSKQWDWEERAEAYDRWREEESQNEAQALQEREAERWAQIERERRERKLTQSDKLLAQADLILGLPITEVKRILQTDADGRETAIQIIKPVRCTKRDAIRLLQAGHELGSQAIRNDGAVHSIIEEQDIWDFVPYKPKKEPA